MLKWKWKCCVEHFPAVSCAGDVWPAALRARGVRAASRSTLPRWGSNRLCPPICTYDAPPCGPSVRVGEPAKSRNAREIPTRNTLLPLLLLRRCPKTVYAIMMACWAKVPGARASFADIHEELCRIVDEGDTDPVDPPTDAHLRTGVWITGTAAPRQHTSAHVSTRQHTSAHGRAPPHGRVDHGYAPHEPFTSTLSTLSWPRPWVLAPASKTAMPLYMGGQFEFVWLPARTMHPHGGALYGW